MKYFTKPIIDILIFDEEEGIITTSLHNYSQGQAANYILGQKITNLNSANDEQSAMAGVDARSIPIERVNKAN